jgi:hypothetical protein
MPESERQHGRDSLPVPSFLKRSMAQLQAGGAQVMVAPGVQGAPKSLALSLSPSARGTPLRQPGISPDTHRLATTSLEGITEGSGEGLWQRRARTPRRDSPSAVVSREGPGLPDLRAAAMRSAMEHASALRGGAARSGSSSDVNEEEVAELQRQQRDQHMALLQASSVQPSWMRRPQRIDASDAAKTASPQRAGAPGAQLYATISPDFGGREGTGVTTLFGDVLGVVKRQRRDPSSTHTPGRPGSARASPLGSGARAAPQPSRSGDSGAGGSPARGSALARGGGRGPPGGGSIFSAPDVFSVGGGGGRARSPGSERSAVRPGSVAERYLGASPPRGAPRPASRAGDLSARSGRATPGRASQSPPAQRSGRTFAHTQLERLRATPQPSLSPNASFASSLSPPPSRRGSPQRGEEGSWFAGEPDRAATEAELERLLVALGVGTAPRVLNLRARLEPSMDPAVVRVLSAIGASRSVQARPEPPETRPPRARGAPCLCARVLSE